MTAPWEATRTTWGTRPPWGSSTPSQLLTTPICTTSPAHSWSWCLSSRRTCSGSKRSFIMRRGYRWPLLLHVFCLSWSFILLSLFSMVSGILLKIWRDAFVPSQSWHVLFLCAFKVRKGFWRLPPQFWLGDVSKIRVLDPHFLHQTAEKLLHMPLQIKGRQVSSDATFNPPPEVPRIHSNGAFFLVLLLCVCLCMAGVCDCERAPTGVCGLSLRYVGGWPIALVCPAGVILSVCVPYLSH